MSWRQVEQAAYAKHGGPDGLEEARLRRISTRTEARKKKRSAREAKARLRLCQRGMRSVCFNPGSVESTHAERGAMFTRQGAALNTVFNVY